MSVIDSHCHLDLLKLDQYNDSLDAALDDARQAGVSHFVSIGVDLQSSQTALQFAQQYEDVYCSVGVHPSYHDDDEQLTAELLLGLAQQSKAVVAIGETGLDYHYGPDSKQAQLDRFALQIDVAKTCKKPLIIHTREAKKDTIGLLTEHQARDCGAIMHCFTEDWTMAKQALDLGFYISISGIVTFKNADQVREVASNVPIDRLLVETDSPYLAPVPFRGKPNVPKHVVTVAEFIAELRGIPFESFAQQVTNNTKRVFKID